MKSSQSSVGFKWPFIHCTSLLWPFCDDCCGAVQTCYISRRWLSSVHGWNWASAAHSLAGTMDGRNYPQWDLQSPSPLSPHRAEKLLSLPSSGQNKVVGYDGSLLCGSLKSGSLSVVTSHQVWNTFILLSGCEKYLFWALIRYSVSSFVQIDTNKLLHSTSHSKLIHSR